MRCAVIGFKTTRGVQGQRIKPRDEPCGTVFRCHRRRAAAHIRADPARMPLALVELPI